MAKKRAKDDDKRVRTTLPDLGKKETFEFSRRETGAPPAKNRTVPVATKSRRSAPSSSKPRPVAAPAKPPRKYPETITVMPRKGFSVETKATMPSIDPKPTAKKKPSSSTANVGFKKQKSKAKACGPGRKSASCPSGQKPKRPTKRG